MMTGDAFEAGMARLAAMWPGRSPSGDTAAVYADALMHLDDRVWARAIDLCLRECTFYPVPAEILQRVEAILIEAGIVPVTPEDAWAEVLRALQTSRPGQPSDLAPLTREVLHLLGGLYALRIADDAAEVAAIRRQFVDIYASRRRSIIRRPETMAQRLPGVAAAPALASRRR